MILKNSKLYFAGCRTSQPAFTSWLPANSCSRTWSFNIPSTKTYHWTWFWTSSTHLW